MEQHESRRVYWEFTGEKVRKMFSGEEGEWQSWAVTRTDEKDKISYTALCAGMAHPSSGRRTFSSLME